VLIAASANEMEKLALEKYRAAVIGCSRIAGFIDNEIPPSEQLSYPLPWSHAACYEACDRTDLVACADLRVDVMDRFGRRYGIPKERQYTDFRELIDKERPEILSAATQPEERAEIIIYAVDNGVKAIWAEKALCASLQDADAVVAAVERNGAVLNMHTQKRFDPAFDVAKDLIEGGTLGALKTMIIYNSNALWDGCSHYFDVVKWLNDDNPVAWIQGHLPGGASGRYVHGTDYDDFEGDIVPGDPSAHGIIQFQNGVVAYALLSGRGSDYDIICERGAISCIDRGRLWQMRQLQPPDAYGVELSEFVPFPDFERRSLSLTLLEDLVHALDTGEKPKGGVRLARDITEMILAFIVSHQRGGARVELPLVDVELRHRRLKPPKQPRYEPRYPRISTTTPSTRQDLYAPSPDTVAQKERKSGMAETSENAYQFNLGMCLQFNTPFRDALALGRELGAKFGWVDLDFALDGVRDGGIDAVGKLTEQHGIKLFLLGNDAFSRLYLTDIDLNRPLDNPGLSRDLDRLVEAMQAAAHLGVGAVLAHSFLWPGNWSSWPMRWLTRGGVIAEIDLQKLVKIFAIVLEHAERYDVDVVIGNLPWNYAASTMNFRILAERLGSKRVKFMWGPADNLTIGELDSATSGFQNIRPYLHSIHLKDLHIRPIDPDGIKRQNKDIDYRPLGEGDVDYPTILRSMRDTGCEAVLAVYTHFELENGTQQDAMRIQFDKLKGLIRSLGAHLHQEEA
jgi:predicted dehydrogenase/sugar phosphate isomerase/epimerase